MLNRNEFLGSSLQHRFPETWILSLKSKQDLHKARMFSRDVHVKMLRQQHVSSPSPGKWWFQLPPSTGELLQLPSTHRSPPAAWAYPSPSPQENTKNPTQTVKFNTISVEPPMQRRATASMDQSRTLQSCSEHKCNSFCAVGWGCLLTVEVCH